jgi:hypothetical protein
MEEMRNAYRILSGKTEVMKPLGKPKHRCEVNTQCPVLNSNKIKYISEMKADTELCASSFSMITFLVFFRVVKVIF